MDLLSVVYGAIIGALCTFLGAIAIDWLGRRRNAAAGFYAAFLPELMRLERNERVDARTVLEPAIERHRLAAFTFKVHLFCWERAGLDKAWRTYQGHYDTEQYSDAGAHDRDAATRELALRDLRNLLRFSGFKP